MPELDSAEPTYWPIGELRAAYARGELSPVDVTARTLERIEVLNPFLHAYITPTPELAREQATEAERAYRRGSAGRLAGVPVSVKDVFHVAGVVTTFGSLVYRDHRPASDSGVVKRLREAGAVLIGKTNTAEFGQSATTDNRLGPDCANPWDTEATPGGSSGGAATSVAAGLATAAVGSDGGGSIRIPASFTGLVGLKPTAGLCRDEGGLRAMTEFASPGPLTWRVGDARELLEILSGNRVARSNRRTPLRVGWSLNPEGRPVDPGVTELVRAAVDLLGEMEHVVEEVDLPISGWQEAFGPLVLLDEHRERHELLDTAADQLTTYERRALEEGARLTDADTASARAALQEYRARLLGFFETWDLIITPTTAVTAFPLGERPTVINGQAVRLLWGPFPFTAPFNVSGNPAVSLPVGLLDGHPVGAQLVAPHGRESALLDVAADLEEAVGFDTSTVVEDWRIGARACP